MRCQNIIGRGEVCGKLIPEDDDEALKDICSGCVNQILAISIEADTRDSLGRFTERNRKAVRRSAPGSFKMARTIKR